MSNIWIISDTHFNHANILKFTNPDGSLVRPGFENTQEMNEVLFQNWNNVVRPGDKIYHLGDVVMGTSKDEWLDKHMPRLMGAKRLILGNHDESSHFVGRGHFSKVSMWRYFKEFNILLTHVPVHESSLTKGGDSRILNVHGHIHSNPSPVGPYYNACVEVNNYAPINIEDLASIARKL